MHNSEKEQAFWEACYIASLGPTDNRRAKAKADQAVEDYRERQQVLLANRHATLGTVA